MQLGKKWNYEAATTLLPSIINDTVLFTNLTLPIKNENDRVNSDKDSSINEILSNKNYNISNDIAIRGKAEINQFGKLKNEVFQNGRNNSSSFEQKLTISGNTNTHFKDSKRNSPVLILSIISGSLLLVGLFFYLHIVEGFSITKTLLIVLLQLIGFYIAGFLLTLFFIQLFQSIFLNSIKDIFSLYLYQ